MELREATRRLIAEVEQQTGYTVVIPQDATLTTLSGLSMAGPQRPSHLVRIHPNAPAGTDYYAVFYCRMIQRFYENPPSERFVIGYEEKGRYRVRKLIRRTAIGKRLDAAALEGVCERLIGGLVIHVRYIPIGLRIDDWILREHPELAEMQPAPSNPNCKTTIARPARTSAAWFPAKYSPRQWQSMPPSPSFRPRNGINRNLSCLTRRPDTLRRAWRCSNSSTKYRTPVKPTAP